jgi:hypothetical protein
VDEEVFAGATDPTRIELPEGRFRLLHLGIKSRSRARFIDVAVFFRSAGQATCSAARSLAERVQKLSGAHTVEIQIRDDSWFASLSFPLIFRFEPDDQPHVHTDLADRVTPPGVAPFYRAPQATGYWNAGGFSCVRTGVIEQVP